MPVLWIYKPQQRHGIDHPTYGARVLHEETDDPPHYCHAEHEQCRQLHFLQSRKGHPLDQHIDEEVNV